MELDRSEKAPAESCSNDDSLASVDWLAFMPDASQFFIFRRPSGNYRPGTLKRYGQATGKELQVISDSLVAQLGTVDHGFVVNRTDMEK